MTEPSRVAPLVEAGVLFYHYSDLSPLGRVDCANDRNVLVEDQILRPSEDPSDAGIYVCISTGLLAIAHGSPAHARRAEEIMGRRDARRVREALYAARCAVGAALQQHDRALSKAAWQSGQGLNEQVERIWSAAWSTVARLVGGQGDGTARRCGVPLRVQVHRGSGGAPPPCCVTEQDIATAADAGWTGTVARVAPACTFTFTYTVSADNYEPVALVIFDHVAGRVTNENGDGMPPVVSWLIPVACLRAVSDE